ncbi:DNA-directed RNA polymerase [Terribacillus halophilus]|uniref:DNA-directed RNA polymerase n=1 Tax=Terribacillus halophilus TaxID=361279 RepID=A0A1G6IM20_9BACI|nr:sigma-70 family RNA polymerase sigma factor [Terribacillus halophilus]SDC07612.1 DNA-directed RNA polymerase [Terribacillus halophilus]
MKDIRSTDFQLILDQYKNMIHYHIHRMRIRDPHDEFLQEGIMALFLACNGYDETKGDFNAYVSRMIRFRLIDHLRKIIREQEKVDLIINEAHTLAVIQEEEDLMEKQEFWDKIKHILTDKQYKWVYWRIKHELTIKEIAHIENTTEDAVKNWGREVKKKLKEQPFILECRNK